jgi:hypothetical protein
METNPTRFECHEVYNRFAVNLREGLYVDVARNFHVPFVFADNACQFPISIKSKGAGPRRWAVELPGWVSCPCGYKQRVFLLGSTFFFK